MTEQDAIERAFLARAAEIEGIRTVADHEPERVPTLPAVTLVAHTPREGEPDLAGVVDVFWSWTVSVLVANAQWEKAQRELKQLLHQVLAIPRADRRLGDTCDWAEIAGDGDEPDVEGEKGKAVLRATLTLTAETVGLP